MKIVITLGADGTPCTWLDISVQQSMSMALREGPEDSAHETGHLHPTEEFERSSS